MENNPGIYLDNAATTSVDPQVFEKMKPFFSESFANPSSIYYQAQVTRGAIDKAREQVANALGSKSEEIIFTSCATESINLSHKGLIEALIKQEREKPHIITSSIEHSAVLKTCENLQERGLAEVTYLPVDKFGLVSISGLEKAIKPNTRLVSIMFVNNEVGTVEPIKEIGKLLEAQNKIRAKEGNTKIYFHTDATQAIQYFKIDVKELNLDMLSLTGHKFYAPKGIGALYLKEETPIMAQINGGHQEYSLRAGTENVASIVGLGEAIDLVERDREETVKRLTALRDFFIKEALKVDGVSLTGHKTKRSPHIASFVVDGAEGEAMLLLLSDKEVMASSGSACTSGSLKPSHVLLAMGVPQENAHGSLRFSFSSKTTKEELEYTLSVLPGIINKVRQMAPRGI